MSDLTQLWIGAQTFDDVEPRKGYVYEYRLAFDSDIGPDNKIRILIARWRPNRNQPQIEALQKWISDPNMLVQILDCTRVKFAVLVHHSHVIRNRIREDINAIKDVLAEISTLPLGMVHRTIPDHIPIEHKLELVPGLRELNYALEEAVSNCTYAQSRIIIITNGAEENHRTFIHKGLWASGEGGQVPKTVDIQTSLTSAAESQREIRVWQEFFHSKLDKLHYET